MAMMHIREEGQHQHSRRAGEYGRGAPLSTCRRSSISLRSLKDEASCTASAKVLSANRKNKARFFRRITCSPGACPMGGCLLGRLRGGGTRGRRPL
jgi:hypothetical protein